MLLKIEQMNSFLESTLQRRRSPVFYQHFNCMAYSDPGRSDSVVLHKADEQYTADGSDAPGAQTMNTMMMTMPLVSVFFCFTFPAAIGIYWVVQGAFQIVQQLAVNSYMNKVDMDELIQKNVDKMNKKRAKKGLPPAKVNQNASAN